MKTSSFRPGLIVCAVAAMIATLASAEETKSQAKSRSSKGSQTSATIKFNSPEDSVTVTGSRIPRKARKSTLGRDVDMSVMVVDRKQIDSLGGGTLAESLRKVPMLR